jgi:hypothetical protein
MLLSVNYKILSERFEARKVIEHHGRIVGIPSEQIVNAVQREV